MDTINLSLSNSPPNPSTLFFNLSKYCDELHIKSYDVYGDYTMDIEKSWLRSFEKEVSSYFGKEDGLFLPSGTMAQAITLLVAQQNATIQNSDNHIIFEPKSFLCHYSSHIIIHENRGYDTLLKMNPIIIGPDEHQSIQQPLSYSDIQSYLQEPSPTQPSPSLEVTTTTTTTATTTTTTTATTTTTTTTTTNSHDNDKPFALVLELPHREIGGKCTTMNDIIFMSKACRKRGIHFHMDGARLWEASASIEYESQSQSTSIYDAKVISNQLTSLFDSVYVSFYKGLGGVTGAMLIGSEEFIVKARVWQRRFGGNLYSLLPYGVSCWKSFRQDKNIFLERRRILANIIKTLEEKFIVGKEKPLLRFDPPIPQVSMIHVYLSANLLLCIQARDQTTNDTGIICFTRIRECVIGNTKGQSYFELNLGPSNGKIPIENWIRGWEYFLDVLSSLLSTTA